jgi:hypothetical protein
MRVCLSVLVLVFVCMWNKQLRRESFVFCMSLSLGSNPKLCGLQGYLPFTRSLLELRKKPSRRRDSDNHNSNNASAAGVPGGGGVLVLKCALEYARS